MFRLPTPNFNRCEQATKHEWRSVCQDYPIKLTLVFLDGWGRELGSITKGELAKTSVGAAVRASLRASELS